MSGAAWWVAVALMLMAEGLMPLLNPSARRRLFGQLMAMSDGQLRFLGLASMLCGGLLLWIVIG
ncbi:DUF2065 domain-containing protein [Roseateles amylovorans]|uniref:DUF2065 domain-containing protein n=1 Tax=Roseateles amylovorans TaxID=2978473 RepID=A0ABY6AWK0_9BURK|nr:DUF2065 domain-containing protein [Roseateles amylovorans]UXH77057.1 DUF2065 domain-containing protein [Roseateles amylovorans]